MIKSIAIIMSMLGMLSAETLITTEFLPVSSSQPIFAMISEDVPKQSCSDVKERVDNGTQNADVVGALAGGALGGILGHNVGGGRGKTAATVGGAVLGVLAGQNIGSKYNSAQSDTYRLVKKCETVYTTQTRQIQRGFVNIAKLKGQEIRVESQERMNKIPVEVSYKY